MEILSNIEYINIVIPIQARIFNREGRAFRDNENPYVDIFSNHSCRKMVIEQIYSANEDYFWDKFTSILSKTNPESLYMCSLVHDVCYMLEPQELRAYYFQPLSFPNPDPNYITHNIPKKEVNIPRKEIYFNDFNNYYCMFSVCAKWGLIVESPSDYAVIAGSDLMINQLRKAIPNLHQDVFHYTFNTVCEYLNQLDIDYMVGRGETRPSEVYEEVLKYLWESDGMITFLTYVYGEDIAKRILQITSDITLSFKLKGKNYNYDSVIATIDDSYLNWD